MKNGMIVSRRKKARRLPKQHLPNNPDGNPFTIGWPLKGGTKLVGGYIPQRDAEYLNLLALYRRTTISDIFREAIEKVLKAGEDDDHMLHVLASRAVAEWNTRVNSKQGEAGWLDKADIMARYREYQHEVRLLLIKRNLAENLIMRIIKKMEAMYGTGR